MRDVVRDDMVEPSCLVLLTAGVIGKGSQIQTKPKNTVEALSGLTPIDFIQIGEDFTTTSPEGHASPFKLNAASKSKRTALAA